MPFIISFSLSENIFCSDEVHEHYERDGEPNAEPDLDQDQPDDEPVLHHLPSPDNHIGGPDLLNELYTSRQICTFHQVIDFLRILDKLQLLIWLSL